MSKLISIVMPAWGLSRHLDLFDKAVQGIIDQTYKNWELLIACDGPSKVNVNCVKEMAEKHNDKRIRLFKSKRQCGPGIIRNMASQHVKGDYITFHDTDDYSEPTRFEKLMDAMDENGIVASNVIVNTIYENTNHSSRLKTYSGGDKLSALIEYKKAKPPVHLPSAIISIDLFRDMGGFEMHKYSADATLAIKIGYLREMMEIEPIPVIEEPLFVWNRHSYSVTTMFKNAYTVRKCQKRQRKPLVKVFRKMIIEEKIVRGEDKEAIKKALFIKNNLTRLPDILEIT